MDLRSFLLDELNKRKELTEPFKETIKIEDPGETDPQEPVEVSQEFVRNYLIQSGFDLTPENYEITEQMLLSMQSNKSALDPVGNLPDAESYKTVNHLNDLTVDELSSLLNVAVLNALHSINRNVSAKAVKYTYAVETVLNAASLQEVLEKYSHQGYRAVNTFADQPSGEIVIIFEKPVYEE